MFQNILAVQYFVYRFEKLTKALASVIFFCFLVLFVISLQVRSKITKELEHLLMFFKLLGSKYFLLKFVLISFCQKLTLNSPLCVGKLLIIYLQHV